MADSLQAQGVPIPNKLGAPNGQANGRVRNNAAPQRRHAPKASGGGKRQSRIPRYSEVSQYNPANAGTQTTSGVGGLEAEFLVAIVLLISLMFADGSTDFSSKMMSVMKRGTLVCVLFFILALVASAGPNAAKSAKAFGALVIVGILLTSPMNTVFKDFDSIIKNDWTGSSETEGGTAGASADGGSTGASSSSAQDDLKGLAGILSDLNPAIKFGNETGTALAPAIKKYLEELPGSIANLPSNLLHKLGL